MNDLYYLALAIIGLPTVIVISGRYMHTGPLSPTPPPAPPSSADRSEVADWISDLACWTEAQRHAATEREYLNRARWQRVVAILFVVAVIMSWSIDARSRVVCESRNRGRADARASDLAIVDEVTDFAVLEPDARDVLLERVTARAMEELPPLDC